MFTKIAIIAAVAMAGVRAEEDEFEPFFLRMLNSNTTAAPTTQAANTTAAPTTQATNTTAAPTTQATTAASTTAGSTTAASTTAATTQAETTAESTSADSTTAASTEAASTTAGTTAAVGEKNVATITATIAFPLPAGVPVATFVAALMNNAAVLTVLRTPLEAKFCAGETGCSVTITDIAAARRALRELAQRRLAASAVDLAVTYEVVGLSDTKMAEAENITTADMATMVTDMKTAIKASPAALAALGVTAAEVDSMMTAKAVSATVVAATTQAATTTAAATTTSGAFEQSAIMSIALVFFSRLLF